MNRINFQDILDAQKRINKYIISTPLLNIKEIDSDFGCKIFFKMDNQQITHSFKARGAFNAVLNYQEKFGKMPAKIVAQSSGNHAQAVAFVGKYFSIPVLIYMASITSPFKVQATRDLGAEVILCTKRSEANFLAEQKQQEGYFFIHPSDNDDVIAGQGTCALEVFENFNNKVTAIFAPCGGGGLLSGTLIASKGFDNSIKVIGCEPINANDAKRSIQAKNILGYNESPNTIADGARTLKVSSRCFNYLQQLSDIIEISEEKIEFWQKKLCQLLDQKIEPTAALSMAGCEQYIQNNSINKDNKFVVIISGGNL